MIEDEEFTHLKVTRAKVGDQIEVINGKGTLSQGRIISLERNRAQLEIVNTLTEPPPPPLILAQALPRKNRLDTILEKGTELGVTEFWLFPGDLSEKQGAGRADRIVLAATKQCGRLWLPEVKILPHFSQWDPLPHPAYFGDLDSKIPLDAAAPAIVFIGPESGFSEREVALLRKQATGVTLGKHILRTDTAAIVAIALLNTTR